MGVASVVPLLFAFTSSSAELLVCFKRVSGLPCGLLGLHAVCVYVCCACVYTYVWALEIDVLCLSQLFPLYIETGSPTKSEPHMFVLTGWPVSPEYPPVSASPFLGLQIYAACLNLGPNVYTASVLETAVSPDDSLCFYAPLCTHIPTHSAAKLGEPTFPTSSFG